MVHLHGNFLDYFVVFFSGIFVSFTPCVYPLIPVTAASIAGVNTSKSPWVGFLLSLVYVLGMTLSYSILAAIAILTGKVFGVIQQSPWVSLGLGIVFVLFALMMWDVLPLPVFSFAPQSRPKTPWTVFLLGFACGFVIGPCTAPILGTLLLFIASKQNLAFGISLLFVFAYGLGTSLILAGTLSGFLSGLPKPGAWMVWIKRAAGLVFLVVAVFYFIRVWSVFH
ncbi:MAG: sulfite exporter TauE/SafE family protein [Candidatus Omnitrophica bacterium]|nr:sulfite exporter TauE/SafE family protein [Candidatus Omnitrophota bacterium]